MNTLKEGTFVESPKHKYTIEQVLGTGGFGITYKVSAKIMVDNIPVKVYFCLKEHYIKDCCQRETNGKVIVNSSQKELFNKMQENFKSEATRLNMLNGKHKGIVRVNEIFNANNTSYYVMEYIIGSSVRTYVETKGPYNEKEAISIINEIGETLSFLHSRKITHLDVKPDNIMLQSRDNDKTISPVLIDFGLAKHYDRKDNLTTINNTQCCSCGYSPMEQYVCIEQFSPTSDVYALAATLFFMLTAKDPVVSTEISYDYLNSNLPATISYQTRNAIAKAMEKDKEERTQTINDFINNLNTKDDNNTNLNNETKIIIKNETKQTPEPKETVKVKTLHYVIIAIVFATMGFFTVDIINSTTSSSPKEMDVIAAEDEASIVYTAEADSGDVDMQKPAKVTIHSENSSMAKELKRYVDLSQIYCDKAEKKKGNKASIQIILDAKYFYYDKANSIHKSIYGKRIENNKRIDKLVADEYNYWINKGNKLGKNKKNYALKKEYYENAYKLVESDRIRSYIKWLEKQI